MFQKILTGTLLTLIALGGFFVSYGDSRTPIAFDIPSTYAKCLTLTDGTRQCDAYMSEPAKNQPQAVKDMYNTLIEGLNIILGIITIIVSPAIMMAGWLMSPDWTSGDLFGLRPIMYSLWVTISNITYFIYAVLLIFIALATIFGRENFGYKAMLPKLALGILMVPFTWWFVQWTISLASVVTAAVITIPEEALRENITDNNSWWNTPSIPTNVTIDESSKNDKLTEDCVGESNCISPDKILTKSSGMYGHMLIYAYGIFKLDKVKKIDTKTDVVVSIVQLIHGSLISIIMLVVFGLLTLALVFMLMARAVMLWVYTIFSPFMTLQIVMGGIMQNVSKDFSIKEFVGLAFVPALVGLALSFGLVIVATIQNPTNTTNVKEKCDIGKLTGDGCTIANLMGNAENSITRKLENTAGGDTDVMTYKTLNIVKFGGITFTFKGKPTVFGDNVAIEKEARSVNETTSILSAAGGIFGTLVVDIISLLFIWMAFMAAKGVSKIVDVAVKPFEDMGKKIGGLAASLPKYTPLPLPGGSLSGMQKTVEMGTDKFKAIQDQKSMDNIGKTFPGLVKGIIQPKDLEELTQALRGVKSTGSIEDFNKVGAATAKLQKTAEYSNANYETIRQQVKQGNWSDADIDNHLNSKNIIDPQQRALLKKLYKGEEGLSDNEKKKIWEANQTVFGTGGTKKEATDIVKKINDKGLLAIDIGGQTIQITAKDTEVDISKEMLAKINGKQAGIKKTDLKNNLLKTMSEKAADDLIKKLDGKLIFSTE